MNLQDILHSVCDRTPGAIGAVLCDFDGESVVTALGEAEPPPEASARAQDHVPRQMQLQGPVSEFLIRLCGAEPCGLLRQLARPGLSLGAGHLGFVHFRYLRVEVLVQLLVEDYYLVLVQRRPATVAHGRRALSWAEGELRTHLQ